MHFLPQRDQFIKVRGGHVRFPLLSI